MNSKDMENPKGNPALRIILYLFSGLGAMFSAYLVIMESYNPGYCPQILDIPACYPVLVCYILVFVSLFIYKRIARYLIFYISTLTGLAIAFWFSLGQLMGTGTCPGLLDIPLCYASMALFIIILISGAIEVRKKRV